METPRYEYSRSLLKQTATDLAKLKAPYGFQLNYAFKANTHPEIAKIFNKAGLGFDASSSFEADLLLEYGVPGEKISLSSQQSAKNLQELVDAGVHIVATSMKQLTDYVNLPSRPDSVGIRINPGTGSGYNNRLTTGGANASFGIWHDYIPEALKLAAEHDVKITYIQSHIGTGSEPDIWSQVAADALGIIDKFPHATTLNLGGGFKTGYQPGEPDADMQAIIEKIADQISDYANDSGRKIKLEIEPGRYLVAHAGTLIATVDDIVDTGKHGHQFLRLNTGMNDFMRTAMYGSYHRMEVLNDASDQIDYVVVGHNCETSDTLTVEPGDPEILATRLLNRASIGDEFAIYDVGAYCASMRARGYNSYPDAIEVMVD